MNLFHTHPILVLGGLAVLVVVLAFFGRLAGLRLVALWRRPVIRIAGGADPSLNGDYVRVRPRSYLAATCAPASWSPPLARGLLRGRRFRWSREEARGQLYRLAARATRGDDEEAARFLEGASLALRQGGAVVSEGVLVSVAGLGHAPLPSAMLSKVDRDLRREDVAELERRQRQDLADSPACRARGAMLPGERRAESAYLRSLEGRAGVAMAGTAAEAFARAESAVFRDGSLVGYLLAHQDPNSAEGAVLAFANGAVFTKGKTWKTDSGDHLLAELPAHAFRIAVLALFLVLAGLVPAQAAGRVYHPEALAWVATEPPGSAEVPTHLRIEGEVAYVHHEPDGDVHVRLCHNGRCMVAECMPHVLLNYVPPVEQNARGAEACLELRVGQRVAVWGISRYDGAPGHGEQAEAAKGRRGHWEVHPVEGIEVLP
jgi:hypothetical protein